MEKDFDEDEPFVCLECGLWLGRRNETVVVPIAVSLLFLLVFHVSGVSQFLISAQSLLDFVIIPRHPHSEEPAEIGEVGQCSKFQTAECFCRPTGHTFLRRTATQFIWRSPNIPFQTPLQGGGST